MTVDPSVYQLSKDFLDDVKGATFTDEEVQELAEMVQQCIEDYISSKEVKE
jgi:hypothetical protein